MGEYSAALATGGKDMFSAEEQRSKIKLARSNFNQNLIGLRLKMQLICKKHGREDFIR